ncbi:RNA polymerase sigma factor [Paenibacillus tuaregi]|uniref:RNA polymerase sigma factor n=1 Tax=Paenibacillus tuaregi TaxID=1816681 RepID=UPI0008383F10|nr:RNA polymerase sigma factor [Paenibacillus tuaregi]
MDEIDLHQIITDILNGDTSQFEKLMHRYQRQIFLYCYHMLGHYAEAEDSTQEVFIKAFRHLSKYKLEKPFEAWLYTIASNNCVDIIRKRRLVKYLPFLYRRDEHNQHVDQVIEDNYYNEHVLRVMSKLTPEERSLLILRCVEDKSYQEIGEIMRQNSTSLRKKFERTAAKFRKYHAQTTGGLSNGSRQQSRSQNHI